MRLVLKKLADQGLNYWLIGGFVRDWVGGFPNHRDIDIAANATVFQLNDILGGKVIKGRHPLVKISDCEVLAIPDLEHDLLRRDFTANALAIAANGALLDPLGGAGDARNHVFRMTSPGIFLEDPVRLLRLCRLSSRLGWEIEAETWKAALKAAHSLNRQKVFRNDSLRIGLELAKSLQDEAPSRFFRLCREMGLLPLICPPLAKLFEEDDEETVNATLARCDKAEAHRHDMRMAALMMEIAPPGTKSRNRKSAGICRNFLTEIRWDIITGKMDGYRAPLRSAAIAATIRYQNTDFCGRDVDRDILYHCGVIPGFTLGKLLETREKAFGMEIPPEYAKKARERLKHLAQKRSISPALEAAILRFAGISRKRKRKSTPVPPGLHSPHAAD